MKAAHNYWVDYIMLDAASDAGHAECIDTSRSTSGWAVCLRSDGHAAGADDGARILVDWGCKRPSVTAKSSTEAEIVGVNEFTAGSTPRRSASSRRFCSAR